jgi:hypothetical protein
MREEKRTDEALHLKAREGEDTKLLTTSSGKPITKGRVRERTPGKGFSFAMGSK